MASPPAPLQKRGVTTQARLMGYLYFLGKCDVRGGRHWAYGVFKLLHFECLIRRSFIGSSGCPYGTSRNNETILAKAN